MGADEVRTTMTGDVAEVRFGGTFLTAALGHGLSAAFTALEASPVRCVVLTGTGRAFAAGADIGPLRTGDVDAAMRFNRLLVDLADQVARFPVPVLCCLNGMAFGGGVELALACTMRVAHEAAVFGFPEVKVGIVPGSGGLVRLPAVVSHGAAAELVLTGRTIEAAEARAIGLVDEVAPEPLARCHEIAAAIAAAAPLAVRAALEVLRGGAALGHEAGTALVEERLRTLLATGDAAEGFAAFAERRAPRFTGS